MKKFKHLMLDIETMGNTSRSAIVSIGAVEFDIKTGETGKEFYVNVDLQSCLDAGLHVDASTVMWWLKQSDEARRDLTRSKPHKLIDALALFRDYCDRSYEVWGNSARFDCGIVQDAYNILGQEIPWDFRKERCLRTLVSMNVDVKKSCKFTGTLHNAIDDCKFQIEYCHKTWLSLQSQ